MNSVEIQRMQHACSELTHGWQTLVAHLDFVDCISDSPYKFVLM